MLAITADQLRDLVPMRDAVELMKAAFAEYSKGNTRSPLRTPVEVPDGSGISLYMPAYVPGGERGPAASGAKIVSIYQGNAARGLPTINGIGIVLDPATGVPKGLIEGATMTALRTGAVSGAATDLMAPARVSRLVVIGAGVQGVTQVAAVCAVRDIQEIRVADVSADAAGTFAARLAVWNPEAADRVVVAESTRAAMDGAEVVCTATTSPTSVFDDAWVADGMHINAVGSFKPDMQEIPVETIRRSRLVVDAVEAVLHETGDLIIPIEAGQLSRDAVSTELGHLVTGDRPGRTSPTEVTLFKSVGNAIQDMIVGGAALQAAERTGIGQHFSLE